MTTEELRQLIEIPQTVQHWGQEYKITPALVDAVFGDGKKLIVLLPINYRPNRFVVRIDSNWSLEWDGENGPEDWLDDVTNAIEEEFHEWPWADDYSETDGDEEDRERNRRVDLADGLCWGEIEWPADLRVREVPGPA